MQVSKSSLKQWFSILILIGIGLKAYGQIRPRHGAVSIPVFRSQSDSLRIAQLDDQIKFVIEAKRINQKKLDSLQELRAKLYQELIVGFKTVYFPSRDYVLLDTLCNVKDRSGITKLCIYNYRKKEIPDVVFECRSLRSLELINTDIAVLSSRLETLPNLREISIYNTHSGKRIKFSRNRFITSVLIRMDDSKLIPKSFKNLTALEKIDLQENKLTRIPRQIHKNPKLKELNLQHNEITLRRKLKGHPALERLALQYNKIESVPASIRNFSNLRKLTFNYNNIKTVDKAIGSLTKLEHISFYKNQLNEIPEGIFSIAALREIDLFYNQIEFVSPKICNLKNLQVLYLSHNRILELPENLDALTKLEGLHVWDNRLGKLPESIGNMTQLKYLRANHNYLKRLPDSFLQLTNLEELDISHNFISELPNELFSFQKFRILALVDNPWNEATLKRISSVVEPMRAKGVFVHISGDE